MILSMTLMDLRKAARIQRSFSSLIITISFRSLDFAFVVGERVSYGCAGFVSIAANPMGL